MTARLLRAASIWVGMLFGLAACGRLIGLDAAEEIARDAGGGSAGHAGSASDSGAGGDAEAEGSAGAGGGSQPTCAEQYGGGLVGVDQVCGLEIGACKLAIDTDPADGDPGQSCHDICRSAGGECIGIYDDLGEPCTPKLADPRSCTNTDMSSAVCFCSLGCGGGPPCPDEQICSQGQCAPG